MPNPFEMCISFTNSEKAKLIGMIEGGKYAGHRIYITDDGTTTGVMEADPFFILTDQWFRDQKRNMRSSELVRLQHAIRRQRPPEDDELYHIYLNAVQYLAERCKKELTIPNGKVKPCIGKDPTVRAYICGATGSGKTTWACHFIKEILRRRPSMKFYVFSQLKEDEVLDLIKPKRIMIEDSLIEEPIPLEKLEDSVVLFDDIETIPDKQLRDAVANIRSRCLSEGRHHNISTICTNHQITDYKKTRDMLLECEFITFFPQSGGNNSILRLLQSYIGLNKKQVNRLMHLPSRWVTVYNRAPLTALYESGVFLLTDMMEPPKVNEPARQKPKQRIDGEEYDD
jgi:hypothetical protein